MRYLIITYIQRAVGRGSQRDLQTDEVVSVSKKTKFRDISTASVILDFKTRQVIKASLGDKMAPRDFQKIRDFYHQYYAKVIDDLETVWAPKINLDKDLG